MSGTSSEITRCSRITKPSSNRRSARKAALLFTISPRSTSSPMASRAAVPGATAEPGLASVQLRLDLPALSTRNVTSVQVPYSGRPGACHSHRTRQRGLTVRPTRRTRPSRDWRGAIAACGKNAHSDAHPLRRQDRPRTEAEPQRGLLLADRGRAAVPRGRRHGRPRLRRGGVEDGRRRHPRVLRAARRTTTPPGRSRWTASCPTWRTGWWWGSSWPTSASSRRPTGTCASRAWGPRW